MEAALQICMESGDASACYHLARQLEADGKPKEAPRAGIETNVEVALASPNLMANCSTVLEDFHEMLRIIIVVHKKSCSALLASFREK